MLTDEQITKAAFKYHELTGAHHSTFHSGATWANDQNAARIAELEAMLSKSAFDLDGHIILLQAANQQIEKERKRIAELEAQKAELIKALEIAFDAGINTIEARNIVFYALKKYDPVK
jgi:predicted transcriptional regulator